MTDTFFKKAKIVKSGTSRNQCPCGLHDTCITPFMKVTGEGQKKILIVAEAPGKTEDEKRVQLIGDAGKILRTCLRSIGLDLDVDCWKTNACCCRPPGNRTPNSKEIQACRPRLFQAIEELKPEKIILLGKTAVDSFLGERMSVGPMERWVGWKIPDQKTGVWIFPTYHPSYLIRNEKNIALKKRFYRHIKEAIEFCGDWPEIPEVQIIHDYQETLNYLQEVKNTAKRITFDIETTGLKPHTDGHFIKSISFSIQRKSTAFLYHDTEEYKNILRDIMTDPTIRKVAHNLPYEDKWVNWFLQCSIQGWEYDTMIGAHEEDNRKGIEGLKFQTYINFGVVGYDDSISHFLKAKGKSNYAINNIKEAPLTSLMTYNAYDSLYTEMLYDKYRENNVTTVLQPGIRALSTISQNGICIDTEYLLTVQKRLDRMMERQYSIIQSREEVKKFKEVKHTQFNQSSNDDMKVMIYDILGHTPTKVTAGGNPSVDQEALEQIDSDFVQSILRYRKLKKIKDTYIAQFERETANGMIYPNYHLHTVQTFRSSSSSPNFQNTPKRDKEAQKFVRSAVIPRPGHQIMEVDFSGAEVKTSAMYHQDPAMINYILDPSTDMHRDVAMDLFFLKEDEVDKQTRQAAKNGFVFPEFYGDYYASCAVGIWGQIDDKIKEHIKTKGLLSFQDFEDRVKEVEDIFWNKRFTVFRDWKQTMWESYLKNGYIKTLTGTICRGLMDKKDVINYPIQGTSFYLLLWSLTSLQNQFEAEGLQSKIIGQIHDSIIIDVDPNELEYIKKEVRRTMCETIREVHPWVIVPLDIDAEITEINGNWSEMHDEPI